MMKNPLSLFFILLALAMSCHAKSKVVKKEFPSTASVAGYTMRFNALEKNWKWHYRLVMNKITSFKSHREYWGGLQESIMQTGGNPDSVRAGAEKEAQMLGLDTKGWLSTITPLRADMKRLRTINPVPRSLRRTDMSLVRFSYQVDDSLDDLKSWVYKGNSDDFRTADNKLRASLSTFDVAKSLLRTQTGAAANVKSYR